MQLQFLGTGSAFVSMKDNFQSNMIVTSDTGKHFLIDCGSDARHSLEALGYGYQDIDAVYISHLHADHAGGLEWLGFTRKFNKNPSRPKLYIHPSLVDLLWNKVMSGGMQSLQGDRPACLEDYFNVVLLKDESSFDWESIHFQLIKTVHVCNGTALVPSYGLFMTTKNSKVLVTTDTQFKPELFKPYYQQADLIFHDCDLSSHPSPVHANFNQLNTLDAAIKAKMWLYHYPAQVLPDAVAHGFHGFAVKGQSFDI